MRDWSLVSGDLAFSGDVGGYQGVATAKSDFDFGHLDGGVGFDFEVLRFMACHGRIDE